MEKMSVIPCGWIQKSILCLCSACRMHTFLCMHVYVIMPYLSLKWDVQVLNNGIRTDLLRIHEIWLFFHSVRLSFRWVSIHVCNWTTVTTQSVKQIVTWSTDACCRVTSFTALRSWPMDLKSLRLQRIRWHLLCGGNICSQQVNSSRQRHFMNSCLTSCCTLHECM